MDPAQSLSRFERMLLSIIERRGASWFVVTVASVSIGLSVGFTWTLMVMLRFTRTDVLVGLAMAVLVPLLVAPAVAMSLARLLRALSQASVELRHLARTDVLTSVLNRRAFTLDAELLLGTRSDEQLVIAMIDVDRFKDVNDDHGHATGDLALQALAAQLRTAMDATGVVGRLGGDEFAVLALVDRELDPDEVHRVLREACDLGSVIPGLRASVGVLVTGDDVSLAEGLAHADHALYRVKPRHSSRPSKVDALTSDPAR